MATPSLDYELESSQASMLVDTRSMRTRVRAAVCDPALGGIAILAPALVGFIFYSYIEIYFLISLATFVFVRKVHRETGLVMRLPKSSQLIDPRELDLGTKKPKPAEGIVYLGNDLKTKEEIWLTDIQARTHMLFMGTTGSGKTEYLLSLIFNSLIHGSGLVYVDGKADNSLYGKIYSMARSMGREDDVVVINFQTGARDIYGAQPSKLSNTMNPFAVGSSGMLSELMKGLMATGKSDIWSERAASFIEALIKPMVYLRDNKGLLLDVGVVRDYFDLDLLEELAWKKYKDDKKMQESNVLDGLRAYLKSLAGYKETKYLDQAETVSEQHGYITMQLTKSFGSLSDTYGYIMKTPLGEIDFVDVFLNRRILIVLLPALEKSPAELTNLGRIVVASLKATMAKGLGANLEGEWAKVIDSRPTTAPSPFMCVLDEYGYYAVEGFAVVPAQARSLGFSAIFAGQDLPAFEKASKEEAKSTLANTNTKFCGKLECTTTFDYFKSLAGQGYYSRIQRYEQDFGSIGPNSVQLDEAVSIDRLDRISASDLRGQLSGEWFMFFANSIVRVKSFFADPAKVKTLRVNHFIKVARPTTEQVAAYRGAADFFVNAVKSDGGLLAWMDRVGSPSDIHDINEALEYFKDDAAVLMAGKVLAYCSEADIRRSNAFAALSPFSSSEEPEPGDDDADSAEGGAGGGAKSAADVDFLNQMYGPGTREEPNPDGSPIQVIESHPGSLWASPVRVNGEHGASSLTKESEEQSDAGKELYGEISDDFTISSADFAQAGLLAVDLNAQRQDILNTSGEAKYDHSTVFGVELMDPPEQISDIDDSEQASPDVPPLADEVSEYQSTYAQAESEFDAPESGEGTLSREALESGVSQIEAKLGGTSAESNFIGSVVASKLSAQTRYLSHPTTRKLNMKEFEEVARSISVGLGEAPN